jgi:HEPN domain-containing protein
MPGADNTEQVVAEWVARAEEDLKAAAHLLKLGRSCPAGTICFHAQQCVEKYLKAYLVFQGTPFPKTHDIEQLTTRVPSNARPSLTVEEQALLTEYAVGPRYPGWRDVPLVEARRAMSLARRVRKQIRSLLPKRVLSRRKS